MSYPATLDGFRYAWLARTTLATGGLPIDPLQADEIVFTAVLSAVSAVTGVAPVRTAQPMVAVTGGASCLTAVALVAPTRSWLQGGPPPSCPVLVAEDWTTAGAHLFPAAPETLSEDRYEQFLVERNVVYRSSGVDPHALVMPTTSGPNGC